MGVVVTRGLILRGPAPSLAGSGHCPQLRAREDSTLILLCTWPSPPGEESLSPRQCNHLDTTHLLRDHFPDTQKLKLQSKWSRTYLQDLLGPGPLSQCESYRVGYVASFFNSKSGGLPCREADKGWFSSDTVDKAWIDKRICPFILMCKKGLSWYEIESGRNREQD